jgi:NhaA family Na+:H+ antiporter
MTTTSEHRKNWIESNRFIPRRFVRPALQFTRVEAASGIVLIVAAVAAMLWANLSMFGDSYAAFWGTHVEFSVAGLHLNESLTEVVNDGLMAIFFFVVGMEIKRELAIGELRDPRKAAMPAMAALGGMVVPAAIYVFFVIGEGGQAMQGWGIPMATDIAFSLGVLALLGSRAPTGAKLFLLTLAIVDDIGAIAVIAIFYTSDLSFAWLSLGLGGIAIIAVASQVNIRALSFYLVIGVVTWFAFLESGVHATIAGVLIGLLTPARPLYSPEEYDSTARRILDYYPASSDEPQFQELVDHEALLIADVARESVAPLNRLERALHNWSSFAIVPIFALANAGVRLVGTDIGGSLTSNLAMGVAFGLVFGKTIGVTLFSWIAVKSGLGRMPAGVEWRHIFGIAMLAGIGFTVALFIAELAFTDPHFTDLAKIGIFAASIVAGVVGYLVMRSATVVKPTPEAAEATAGA